MINIWSYKHYSEKKEGTLHSSFMLPLQVHTNASNRLIKQAKFLKLNLLAKGFLIYLVTIIKFLRLKIVLKHIKFEIDRTILSCLN